MTMLRYLAVAINSKRLGYVFIIGNQMKDWRMMTKPTKSPAEASKAMQKLIADYQPDVVVTEEVGTGSIRVLSLRRAILRTSASSTILDVSIKRTQNYANKYEEASSLATTYPELQPWVPPKRKFFDSEPPRMILFLATSLAHSVIQQPTLRLAAAMR